jgi:hypothetical protein
MQRTAARPDFVETMTMPDGYPRDDAFREIPVAYRNN